MGRAPRAWGAIDKKNKQPPGSLGWDDPRPAGIAGIGGFLAPVAGQTPQLHSGPISLGKGGPQGPRGTHQHTLHLSPASPIPTPCESHVLPDSP